jgi:hypothetical protein
MATRSAGLAAGVAVLLCFSCASINTPRPFPFHPPLWIQGTWEGSFERWAYQQYKYAGRLSVTFGVEGVEWEDTFYDDGATTRDNYERVMWVWWLMRGLREDAGDGEYVIGVLIAQGEQWQFRIFRKVDDTRIALYECESNYANNYRRALNEARMDAMFIC